MQPLDEWFNSIIDFFSLAAVYDEVKPLSTISVSLSYLDKLQSLLSSLRIKSRVVNQGRFLYYKGGWALVLLWKHDEAIVKLRNVESLPTIVDRTIQEGLAFGYPLCCVRRVADLRKKGIDSRYAFLESLIVQGVVSKLPIWLKIVPHIPCSPHCKESIDLGRRYFLAAEKLTHAIGSKIIEKICKELYVPTLFLWRRFNREDLLFNVIQPKWISKGKVISKLGNLVNSAIDGKVLRARLIPFYKLIKYIPTLTGEPVYLILEEGKGLTYYNSKLKYLGQLSQKDAQFHSIANFRILEYK
ncbi:MAG: hypothetical protein QXO47_03540 [Thermoproteota archaeon]|nr:hypothetical protein [Candidatus Brockarchaeota archaeon]